MSVDLEQAAGHKLILGRPPVTKDELWHVVGAMFGVWLPREQVCPDHQAPFDAFADAYFGNDFNWALWYGSRGCLAGDTQITVSRAGNSARRRMDRFVPRYLGEQSSLGRHLGGGRGYRKDIPTLVQRSQDGYARLGRVAEAYESGVKTTYELVTDSGRRIRATAEHPFDTPEGFVPLGDLHVGAEVMVNVGRSTAGRQRRARYARRPAKWHPMADRGQYWEHRLVAEAMLNGIDLDTYLDELNGPVPPMRSWLSSDTHVHHVDGDPANNTPGNLLVLDEADHHRLHAEHGKTSHVLERIDTEKVASITRYGEEMTFDLTMADAPNNYVANGFVVHNTGKSYMLAILALVKAALLEIEVTILGGSMAQSQNVQEHVENLMRKPNAPTWMVSKQIQSELSFAPGNWIRPLPASQKTVRGPHPHMVLLDEIDEMEKKVYDAAMGQAMDKENARGVKVNEMVVASSTWQNPVGTFQEVIEDAREKMLPIFTWCWREVIEPNGWMSPQLIENKRASVPAEMFRVEYELGEPAGEARAIDLEKVNEYFAPFEPIRTSLKGSDNEWVYADPEPAGTYAAGADWAKEKDMTVLVVARTDVTPRQLVYIRRLNRRPWPYMIGEFDKLVAKYNAVSAHDATGLGNVVHDFLDDSFSQSLKVKMIGQDRTKLLSEYIADFEHGAYRMPSTCGPLLNAHKSVSVDEVWGTARWDSHLPDDIAACAIMHRAAERAAPPAGPQGVGKTSAPPRVLAPLQAPKEPDGVVTVKDEAESSGVAWLPNTPRPRQGDDSGVFNFD